MTDRDNGGSAYPVTFEGGNNSGESPYFEKGMTLRDWFAGQALAGILADTNIKAEPKPVAKVCYACADAMLAARGADQ